MSKVLDGDFTQILERIIQPQAGGLPAEAARYFLKINFSDVDRARMNDLAAKARAASLDSSEEAELASFMQLGWFLDLMKSKSRLSLSSHQAAA